MVLWMMPKAFQRAIPFLTLSLQLGQIEKSNCLPKTTMVTQAYFWPQIPVSSFILKWQHLQYLSEHMATQNKNCISQAPLLLGNHVIKLWPMTWKYSAIWSIQCHWEERIYPVSPSCHSGCCSDGCGFILDGRNEATIQRCQENMVQAAWHSSTAAVGDWPPNFIYVKAVHFYLIQATVPWFLNTGFHTCSQIESYQ